MQVDDIGTILELTIKDGTAFVLDLSTASTKEIIIKSPAGVASTHTASFTTDGTDGKIQYVTTSGDVDEAGRWQIQGRIVMGGGDWKTSVSNFQVAENL